METRQKSANYNHLLKVAVALICQWIQADRRSEMSKYDSEKQRTRSFCLSLKETTTAGMERDINIKGKVDVMVRDNKRIF